MKKSGFAKGVIWTLSIGIVLVVILAAVGVLAYNGYTNAALEASYSRGNTETTIKIEKKDKLSSEIASVDKKQIKFNENLLKDKKKLNFKEHGPFFGIKKGSQWIRGIHVGTKDDYAQSTWYGTFAKDNMYHKGYWAHTYSNGKVIYQYSHFKLDKQGKVIQDEKGKFLIEDSYVISKEDFEKVKLYIQYDIEPPFSFYDFDLENAQTEVVQKKDITTNEWFKWVETYPSALKDGTFLSKSKEKGIKIIEKININSEVYVPDTVNEHFKYFNAVREQVNYIKYKGKKYKVLAAAKNYYAGLMLAAGYHEDLKTAATLALKNCKKQEEGTYPLTECVVVMIGDDRVTFKEQGYWSEVLLKKPTLIKKYFDSIGSNKFDQNYLAQNFLNDQAEKFTIISKKIAKTKDSNPEIKLKYETDEKYYALVIGNNNYEHLEKLDAAENDAEVIADVLTKKYGFKVDLLLNADYDTTVNSLFKITDKLKRNDNLLIYYAGHGELDKAENRGYWLPVDASYEMRSKWISNQRIVDRIKATKAKHVLLVADSCFSGTLMRSGGNLDKEESVDEKYIKRLKNKKTRLVITSGGNEPVVDSVGGDHSLFALKFIDTLKNNNTVINSQILFENVRRYVVANADQTPERAMVHKTGHDGGDFLFFPKK